MKNPVQGVAETLRYTRANGPKENDMRKHERAWDGSSACVEPLEARTLMAADMVLEWNEVAVEATRVARLSPNAQTGPWPWSMARLRRRERHRAGLCAVPGRASRPEVGLGGGGGRGGGA